MAMTTRVYLLYRQVTEVVHFIRPEHVRACVLQPTLTPRIIERIAE